MLSPLKRYRRLVRRGRRWFLKDLDISHPNPTDSRLASTPEISSVASPLVSVRFGECLITEINAPDVPAYQELRIGDQQALPLSVDSLSLWLCVRPASRQTITSPTSQSGSRSKPAAGLSGLPELYTESKQDNEVRQIMGLAAYGATFRKADGPGCRLRSERRKATRQPRYGEWIGRCCVV
jgi:hypothetical protein